MIFWVCPGQVRQMASTLQTSKNVDVKQISSPKFFCSFGQQWGSSKCQAGHRGWNVFWCSPSHSCSAQRLLLQAVHTWKPEGAFPPGRHFFANSEKHLELDVLRKYPNLGKATSEMLWMTVYLWNHSFGHIIILFFSSHFSTNLTKASTSTQLSLSSKLLITSKQLKFSMSLSGCWKIWWLPAMLCGAGCLLDTSIWLILKIGAGRSPISTLRKSASVRTSLAWNSSNWKSLLNLVGA